VIGTFSGQSSKTGNDSTSTMRSGDLRRSRPPGVGSSA